MHTVRWLGLFLALVIIVAVEGVLIGRALRYACQACPPRVGATRKQLILEAFWTVLPAPFLSLLLVSSLLRARGSH